MKFVWGSSSSQKPREIDTCLYVPVMTAETLICILIRSQRQRRTNQSLAVHPSPFSQKLVIKESVNDSTKNQILNNTSSTMVTCTTLQTFYPFNQEKPICEPVDVYRGGWQHQGLTFTTPSRQVLPRVVLSWAIWLHY